MVAKRREALPKKPRPKYIYMLKCRLFGHHALNNEIYTTKICAPQNLLSFIYGDAIYKNLTKEGQSQMAPDSNVLALRCLLHFPHLPLITTTSESHYSNPHYPSQVSHGRMGNFIFPQADFHSKVLNLGWGVPVVPAEARRRAYVHFNTCCVGGSPAKIYLFFSFFSSPCCSTHCTASCTALDDIQACVVQPWSPLESVFLNVIHGYRCTESLPRTFLFNFPIPDTYGYKIQTNAD